MSPTTSINSGAPWRCEAASVRPDTLAFNYAYPECTQTGEQPVDRAPSDDDLPDRARTLLEMFVDKPDCSYDELSATLGIPVGSIGPTRGRSLQRLRANARLVWAVA